MANHIDETVAQLQTLLKKQEDDARLTKTTINNLLRMDGRDPIFSEDEIAAQSSGVGTITPDRWYGQPLATAIREFLTMRKAAGNGAASVRQIYEALSAGGYQFEASNADYAMRGMRTSLRKNTVFHRLPNGTYGLKEWYPNAKSSRGSATETERDAPDDDIDSGESGEK
ncbi:MAG: hypothetical protein KDA30_06715 [Phycisphaerales bacterium]|nr:hypothetical protein [Phycisphaerales bacterium]